MTASLHACIVIMTASLHACIVIMTASLHACIVIMTASLHACVVIMTASLHACIVIITASLHACIVIMTASLHACRDSYYGDLSSDEVAMIEEAARMKMSDISMIRERENEIKAILQGSITTKKVCTVGRRRRLLRKGKKGEITEEERWGVILQGYYKRGLFGRV